jgi:hypothetical protein
MIISKIEIHRLLHFKESQPVTLLRKQVIKFTGILFIVQPNRIFKNRSINTNHVQPNIK